MSSPLQPSAPLILVVEDDMDIRDLLKEFLESAGYDVAVAGNGMEGLSRLRRAGRRPNLVLLDRNMELMDGMLFLEALSEDPDPTARLVPVVMMSAAGVVDEKRVVAFLRKPFNFEELLAIVARYCGTPVPA